jgi:hypothetical protein
LLRPETARLCARNTHALLEMHPVLRTPTQRRRGQIVPPTCASQCTDVYLSVSSVSCVFSSIHVECDLHECMHEHAYRIGCDCETLRQRSSYRSAAARKNGEEYERQRENVCELQVTVSTMAGCVVTPGRVRCSSQSAQFRFTRLAVTRKQVSVARAVRVLAEGDTDVAGNQVRSAQRACGIQALRQQDCRPCDIPAS